MSMSDVVRSVTAKLRLDTRDYDRPAQQSKKVTEELGDAARKTRDKTRQAWGDISDSVTLAGAAVTASVGALVYAGARFEQQMSAVDAVTDASAAQMDRLRQAAVKAGEDTAYSATEAAKAEEELAKAGVGVSDILGGALRGSLDLASAGQLDLAEAADIAAKAMNLFKLRGSDVSHIADVLAAAANKSAADVHQLGESLRMGGLAANAAGMSLEDTVGTLAAFHDRALVGSDAGTSLKTMLQMLAAPTDKAASLMRELGIQTFDAQGNFVGVERLAGILQERLGHLTQEQRNAALATIFGADAMRAANVLYELGATGVRDYIRAVDDQGAASETAAEKTDNLLGDVERLTGSLETLAIESSTGATSGLRSLVQGVDRMVDSLSGIPAPVQNAAVLVAGLTGATLLAAGAAGKMREASARLTDSLADLGPRGQAAARGINRVTVAAGKAGVALAVLSVAGAALGDSVDPKVKKLAGDLEEFAKSGKVGGEAARVFGGDLKKLEQALIDLADTGAWSDFVRNTTGFVEGFGVGGLYDNSLQHSRERLEALDQALTQLVAAGKMDDAKAAFERIAAAAREHGISVNELNQVLPNYSSALDEAAKAGDLAGQAQAKAAIQADLMGGTLEDAAKAAGGLAQMLETLHGAAIDFARTEIDAEEAVDRLTEALKESKGSLDVNTESGRAAKSGLLDLVDAAKQAAQAKLDETGSLEQANAVYNTYIGKLRQTLRQAGLTDKQIDELIRSYASMPPLVQTKVSTPGLSTAISQVSVLNKKIRELPRNVQVSVGVGTIGLNRWGGVYEHAQVGLLREAAVYSARSPGRYMIAEPGTGGEAFVPKNGDPGRSVPILQRAASWYGHRVVPAGGGMSGEAIALAVGQAMSGFGNRQEPVDSVTLGRALRSALRGVTVVLDGRAVGQVEARRADLYMRSG